MATAQILADFLAEHSAIECVYYAGLSDHPGLDSAVNERTGD